MLAFRQAVARDQTVLADVGTKAWCSYICKQQSIKPAQRERVALAFLHFAQSLYEQIVVAEYDSEIIGWGARDTGLDYISDLWIDPAHQRQGIGHSLLDVLVTQIALQGFRSAGISTHQQNIAAMRLYQKYGFKIQDQYSEWSDSLEKQVVKISLIFDWSL